MLLLRNAVAIAEVVHYCNQCYLYCWFPWGDNGDTHEVERLLTDFSPCVFRNGPFQCGTSIVALCLCIIMGMSVFFFLTFQTVILSALYLLFAHRVSVGWCPLCMLRDRHAFFPTFIFNLGLTSIER